MKLLVTGGTGQVGEALRRLAPELGVTVIAPGRDALDLSKPETIRLPDGIEGVINSGAYTAVDKAESEATLAEVVNAVAPGVLAEQAARRGLPIIQISTDYVFDGGKASPYTESDPINPLSVYGRTKEVGERAVRTANDRHVILRTSWVYALHGNNFVKTMLRLGKERDLLRVVADQTGAPTFADDIARAVIACALGLRAGGPPGTYHYTAEGATTWYGLATAIWETAAPLLGRRPKIEPIPTSSYPTPTSRPPNSVLDCTKIVSTFGVMRRPWEHALDEALTRLLADSKILGQPGLQEVKRRDRIEPIRHTPSIIQFSWTSNNTISARLPPAASPSLEVPAEAASYSLALGACQDVVATMIALLSAPQAPNIRSDYLIWLKLYSSALPSEPNTGRGNIFTADSAARTLWKMFDAEGSTLPASFASPLRILLESHQGLRSFFADFEGYYRRIMNGRQAPPAPLEAYDSLIKITKGAPEIFDPSVPAALAASNQPLPKITAERETSPAEPTQPTPPKDPLLQPDLQREKHYNAATVTNALWETFLAGEKLEKGLKAWPTLYEKMAPFVSVILAWLRNFL